MREYFKKCSLCGDERHELELSKQGFCYNCSKKRLLAAFEAAWALKRERRECFESSKNL